MVQLLAIVHVAIVYSCRDITSSHTLLIYETFPIGYPVLYEYSMPPPALQHVH